MATRPDPQRTCVGCRQVKPQRDLTRMGLVEGTVVASPRRQAGRSAYLCRDPACWGTAEKRRALDRALGVQLSRRDWEGLREGILT